MSSPYATAAPRLRDMGYSAMPVMPGTKSPGQYSGGAWVGLPGWARFCDEVPPEFTHDRWSLWPEAGVCIALGRVVALDLDTDRRDVETAALGVLGSPPVRRVGRKGWMGFYRPGPGLEAFPGRLRWYDGTAVALEIMLHGTQAVLPPTIHPETGEPYRWLTLDTLEDVAPEDLPEMTGAAVSALDAALAPLGLTRKTPPRPASPDGYGRLGSSAHDLEKPFGRSLNDRALEPAAIDQWWPALQMPKTRQRGPGRWEAVAWWRGSNSGRSVSDRNPNLKATPDGIIDFGADHRYTPIDLVMCARECGFPAATEWLEQYVRPEPGAEIALALPPDEPDLPASRPSLTGWAVAPVILGPRREIVGRKPTIPSDAEFAALIPAEAGPFPIPSPAALEGLLGEVATYIDAASVVSSEAGALAAALPLLGAVMGRAWETPTGLRTNLYTVAIGPSGSGKTALVVPAKELLMHAGLPDFIGQDNFMSGSGVLQMLARHPCRVSFLDELGHMLKQIGSSSAGMHAKQIVSELTKLYSGSNTLYTGAAYATREPDPIDCPHLCIFGQATPEQFWSAFGSASLEDGSLARFVVFPLGETASKDPDTAFRQDVADGIKDIIAAARSHVSGNLGRIEARVVPFSAEAKADFDALEATMTGCALYAEANGIRGAGPILRRVKEISARIALISAIGRNAAPVVSAQDFAIGHAIARWSACTMIAAVGSYIADNQTEKDVNDVERFIREGGAKGRAMSQITRAFRRVKSRDLREILDSLEAQGSVSVALAGHEGGGRPSKVYVAAG